MIETRRYGERGPLVVLLHGGPGGPGYMAGLARELADRFRVVEPLQRFSGDIPLTVATHVADLRDVLESLGEPANLVGSSWGAMLALSYAARHAEGLRQLVLIGSATFDRESRRVYQERMLERTSAADMRRIERFSSLLAAETDQSRRDLLFAKKCNIAIQIQSHDLISSDFEIVRFDERGNHETSADARRLQDERIQPAEFRSIAAPVLMLHGDQDPHPGRMIYESLTPYIQNLRYREFAHCGHIPWLERQAREEFLEALVNALLRLDS